MLARRSARRFYTATTTNSSSNATARRARYNEGRITDRFSQTFWEKTRLAIMVRAAERGDSTPGGLAGCTAMYDMTRSDAALDERLEPAYPSLYPRYHALWS